MKGIKHILLTALVFISASYSHALPIDSFKTKQILFSSPDSPSNFSGAKSRESIGGYRSINAGLLSGDALHVTINNGLSIKVSEGGKASVGLVWQNIPAITRLQRKASHIHIFINKFEYNNFPLDLEVELLKENRETFYYKLSLDRDYNNEFISVPLGNFGIKGLSLMLLKAGISSSSVSFGSIQFSDTVLASSAKIARAGINRTFKVVATDKKTKGQISGAKITFVSFSGSFKAKTNKYGEATKNFEQGEKVAIAFSHKSYGTTTTKVFALKNDKTLKLKRKWNGKGKQAKYINPDTGNPGTPPVNPGNPINPGNPLNPANPGFPTPDRTTTPNIFYTFTPTPNIPLFTNTPFIPGNPASTPTPGIAGTATRTPIVFYTATSAPPPPPPPPPAVTNTPSSTPTRTNTPTPTIPPIRISISPEVTAVSENSMVTFTATASGGGNGTISYQWQMLFVGNYSNIAGATSANYTFKATRAMHGTRYRCVASKNGLEATSLAAELNVLHTGTVSTTMPAVITVKQGTLLPFTANVSGGYPMAGLKWQKDGVNFTGFSAGSAPYTLYVQQIHNNAVFRAVASNSSGDVYSTNIKLIVTP